MLSIYDSSVYQKLTRYDYKIAKYHTKHHTCQRTMCWIFRIFYKEALRSSRQVCVWYMLCHLSYRLSPAWTLPSSVLKKVCSLDIETNRGGTVMSSAQWSWKVTPSLRGRDTQQGSVKKLTQMSPSLLQSTALSLSHTLTQWYTKGSSALRLQTWQQQKTHLFNVSAEKYCYTCITWRLVRW